MVNNKGQLTEKQKRVLKFIYQTISRNRLPPTIREIAKQFGFNSTGTVRDYLKALVHKGYIKVSPHKSRAIELVREAIFSIPILGGVRAGLPAVAVEDVEGYLNLDSLFLADEESFVLRVKGDSMNGAGILPDDLVVVKKQNMAQTGEIVVALKGEEATVKILRRRDNNYYLEAANPAYPPISITDDVSILGKVINVIRKLS